MAIPVSLMGTIQSYAGSGTPFEKFLIDQAVPLDQQGECRVQWDAIKAWMGANPGVTMLVPSD